jgi:hypothetical protein
MWQSVQSPTHCLILHHLKPILHTLNSSILWIALTLKKIMQNIKWLTVSAAHQTASKQR